MAKQCKVTTVYAPNGEPSKLFLDLRKTFKDDTEALAAWSSIHTPAFKQIFGNWLSEDYVGRLDENGEPFMEDIVREEYIEDQKIREQSDRLAADYISTTQKMADHLTKAKDVLIKRIRDLEHTKKGKKKSDPVLNRLQNTKKKLRALEWRESTLLFASGAMSDVKFAARRMRSELKKENPDPKILRKMHGMLTAFNVLSDMKKDILASKILQDSLKEEIPYINEILDIKDGAQQQYWNYMETRVSEKLAELSEKHDAESIRELLREAPFDIKARERWLFYAGDSRDSVIALVAKVVNESQQKTRKESIRFTKELSSRIDALEEERSQYKGNPEKMYEPMLAKDRDGNFTGYLVNPETTKKQFEEFERQYEGTAMMEFYKFFLENYAFLNGGLPMSSHMGYRIPSLLKSTLQAAVSGKNTLENVRLAAKNSIQASNSDIEKGRLLDDANRAVDSIPIHFTQRYDKVRFDEIYKKKLAEGLDPDVAKEEATSEAIADMPKRISYDLGASLQAFHYMATNYSNMSEIIDVVEGAKDMVFNRKVTVTDMKGNPIVSHMKDFMGDRVYNNKEMMEGSESNAYKMIEAFIEMQVYGQTELDLGGFSLAGMDMDTRKLLKHMQKYSSNLMLGVNFLAGTANILMGETMQWADAFSGEYYSAKDYAAAKIEYSREMHQMVADLSRRTPESKVNLFSEFYDFLGDYHPDGVSDTDFNAGMRLAKSTSLFFINSIGEHMMQNQAAIAIFKGTKTFDADGNSTGTLWDAHKAENGVLKIDDTYIKDSEGNLVKYDQKQQDKMSRKTQALLRRMHGNYNSQTAAEWQRNGILNLVGQFRKWLAPGLSRRLGKGKYMESMDQDVEGTYRTTAKFMINLAKELTQGNIDVVKQWKNLSTHERSNVVRTTTEAAVFVSMIATSMLLKGLIDDLEDEDKEENRRKLQALRYGIYLTNRLNTELLSFVNPLDMWKILKSPAASMSLVERTAKTLYYSMPWNWDEKYESGAYKGESKLLRSFQRQIPFWHQLHRMSPDGIKSQIEFLNTF